MELITTASGRIAGSKRQIGEALCTIAGKKSNELEKILRDKKSLLIPVDKIKAIIVICIALTVFYLQYAIYSFHTNSCVKT